MVDDCDFKRLNQFKWYAHKRHNIFYAARMARFSDGKRYAIHMHHEIIGTPPCGFMPDHRNGQGIDNRRKNLRFVTNRQNQQNQKNYKSTSKFPGVCWDKARQKWKAAIQINKKTKHLGRFINEKKASEAYKQAVNELGEEMVERI